ncbi:uncharacterized protein LOC124315596 isoform X2 [Daphnia pulicaria]|uniref:uncharacterized protein LOC124315596 isoform X2 n=1 Tax=Daphnia pulicaria TaxID=35523 RepID=UPI001EEC5D9B|nr:uncharacterized protein LOC124315596 isoform X2 [Daphnia pulicaria]
MISMVILASLATLVASAPAQTKTIINVDGPDGHQHVQTGEPGKAVSGYFTSRNSDGVEEKTIYEADEKGFRATGAHLPVAPSVFPVQRYSAFPSVYPVAPVSSYGYRYAPQNYYPYYYPSFASGKYGSAKDYLSSMYDGGYRTGEDFSELSMTPEEMAEAKEQLEQITPEELAVLTERGPLTPFFLPMILANKKNIIMMMIANKILTAMGG